jgi:hypothetical protein
MSIREQIRSRFAGAPVVLAVLDEYAALGSTGKPTGRPFRERFRPLAPAERAQDAANARAALAEANESEALALNFVITRCELENALDAAEAGDGCVRPGPDVLADLAGAGGDKNGLEAALRVATYLASWELDSRGRGRLRADPGTLEALQDWAAASVPALIDATEAGDGYLADKLIGLAHMAGTAMERIPAPDAPRFEPLARAMAAIFDRCREAAKAAGQPRRVLIAIASALAVWQQCTGISLDIALGVRLIRPARLTRRWRASARRFR